MKKTYIQPSIKVINIDAEKLLCGSPNSGISTQNVDEEYAVEFE